MTKFTEKKQINLFNDWLELTEFTLLKHPNGEFSLSDEQGANLGDIESETFENIQQVIDRMDIYVNDYIYRSLEEREEAGEEIPEDDFDYQLKEFIENADQISLDKCLYKEVDWNIIEE